MRASPSRWTTVLLLTPLLGALSSTSGCFDPSFDNPTQPPRPGGPGGGSPPDLGSSESTLAIECGALPDPPAGQRCAATPAKNGKKGVLLRGAVLLPDRVLHGGEVLVDEQGKIACAACDCHSDGALAALAADSARITCRDGVISPGLINSHDHLAFTKAEPGTHPTHRYDHRHEWRLGVSGDPNRPAINVPGGANTAAMQWGELRQVMAGTTSLVGSNQVKGLLRNIDNDSQEGLGQKPVEYETFPLGDSSGTRLAKGCGYPSLPSPAKLASVDSYAPHIAEGINDEARNELLCLSSNAFWGQSIVDRRTAMIHGVGVTVQDARLLAARKAAVIWSPRSNVSLYGNTAPAPMLDRAGVLLALGTDWTASGSMNMLRELACAADLNQNQFGRYFSSEALWRMATLNGALATATADVIGQLVEGYVADVSIFIGQPKAGRRDHAAVVRAGVEDVALVLRGGRPLYGDAAVLESLGADDGGMCEALDVCGVRKRACVQRETGKKLADLETSAGKPLYTLFACGTPPKEPTCVPSRTGEFSGVPTGEDADGDGIPSGVDNCPTIFNPVRPLDHGRQPDSDGDGVGDACDPCPLARNAKDATTCSRPDPADEDGDGIPNATDNCPQAANPDQRDADLDGQGDLCDACPQSANPMAAACPFTVKELRDPARGMRPPEGTHVKIRDLLVLGLRTKKGFGFHARDLSGGSDFAGILVFLGGSAPPKATDGTPLQVGHIVSVTGTFTVFTQQDELDDVTEVKITGMDPTAVQPIDIATRELLPGQGSPAERLENLLVRVRNVTMRAQVDPAKDDDLYITDDMTELCAGPTAPCTRMGDYLLDGDVRDGKPAFTRDAKLSAVQGIVSGFSNLYTLEPRETADIVP